MSHARLSPSGSGRWSECTASVMFIEDHAAELPPSGGVHADEGTDAHEQGKNLLKSLTAKFASPEMERCVKAYVNFVVSKYRDNARVLIEERVPLFYDVKAHGTVDAAIVSPELVEICDLKYGAGVSVEAVGNKQLAIYAMSLIAEQSKITPMQPDAIVRMHIFQPRDRNNPEPVRTWELSFRELYDFCKEHIESAVVAINSGQVQFKANPEKQCRFCPAKGICKAFASYGLEALPETVQVLAAEPVLPDANTLTREQRIRVIRARKALEQWLEAVEDQEVSALMNGEDPAGYKLVEGKTNRQWADEDAALGLLRRFIPLDELRPPAKLVSPAQAEKLLAGQKMTKRFATRWNSLITKPEGKPSLVPETDKRPALSFNKTSEFVNLEEIV